MTTVMVQNINHGQRIPPDQGEISTFELAIYFASSGSTDGIRLSVAHIESIIKKLNHTIDPAPKASKLKTFTACVAV